MSRVALVVGGTGGIGRAACERLAGDGLMVVSMSRSGADFVCDVTNLASVESAFGAAWAKHGRFDVLVNAFGAEPCTKALLELTDDDFRMILETDVVGCMRSCRQFMRYPCEHIRSIVNVSSYHAIATYTNRVPYATAKAAVVGMTQALAVELGPQGVAVNALLPGQVDSPRSDRLLCDKKKHAIRARSLSGKIPTCHEVADAILFLSRAKPWTMNGASLVLDGGWTRDACF